MNGPATDRKIGATSRADIESWHARGGFNECLEHDRVVKIGTGDPQCQRHLGGLEVKHRASDVFPLKAVSGECQFAIDRLYAIDHRMIQHALDDGMGAFAVQCCRRSVVRLDSLQIYRTVRCT